MAIQLNVLTHIVEVTNPTTEVIIQELVDGIRDWEDEMENLSYKKVVSAVGKANLGGGIETGIVMTLSNLWQIQFWGGSGYTVVKGGTLVGGVGSKPVKATGTANDITIQIQPTDATIVTASEDLTFINDIEGGKWNITDEDGGTMIFYKADNVTEVCRFALYDINGVRTSKQEEAVRRDRI